MATFRNRLDELERENEMLRNAEQEKKSKQKGLPKKFERMGRKSMKKKENDKILFVYMRRNGIVDEPKLVKYDDNVIFYNWKAYDFDPRAVWQWGKYKFYFYKEVDRRPVSNLNYRVIKQRGDLTDGDEILIKATMKAVMEGVKKKMNKTALIILGVALVAIIIFFVVQGGNPEPIQQAAVNTPIQ
jgi:hypothetical protein